jgi:amino acid permease
MTEAGNYEVDQTGLIIYLAVTLASIVFSLAVFFYFMECSEMSKNDREEVNSRIYNYIVEEDGQP